MIRILGNSLERVSIPDLKDVIYYKQLKDYSDQEYDSSRDLQREIQKGRVIVLSRSQTPRGLSDMPQQASGVSLQDVRQAVREVLSQDGRQERSSIGDVLKDLLPSLLNSVRQELSSFVGRADTAPKQINESFVGPEYVPSVDTSGMISNVDIEAKEISGDGVDSSMDALRKLRAGQ